MKIANETKHAMDFVIIMVGSGRNAKAQAAYMKKAKMPFFAAPREAAASPRSSRIGSVEPVA